MTGLAFLLTPSPFVGPGTWEPVATSLRARDLDVAIADLRGVCWSDDPVAATAGALRTAWGARTRSPIIVSHSGAGPLVPGALDMAQAPLAERVIFVDAGLPLRGEWALTPPSFLERLRSMADDTGQLPRWSEWWDPTEVEALVPDDRTRAALIAEMSPVPLAYLERSISVPERWPDIPGAYLLFEPEAYQVEAERAARWGWPVATIPHVGHLGMVRRPDLVAATLLELATASRSA